jgi:HAD superfamily hydrolase (TIGR01509 family)
VSIRALLFDYGGTLDGAASHWLDRFAGMYREAGTNVAFERLKAAFYDADRAAYAEPRIRSAALADLMEFHVGIQLRSLRIDDGALHHFLVERFVDGSRTALAESRAILAELAGSFALGVVSNFYGNVERILRDAGIGPLLGVVADSTVIGAAKPEAAIFRHAVARLGIPAGETLHVGDSYERDVLGARAAGLHAAWLTGERGASATGDRDAADVRLASLHELRPWLLRGSPSRLRTRLP